MRRDGTIRLGHPGRQALSNASRLCCFKALAIYTAAGRAALSRNGLDYTRETRVRNASLRRVISKARLRLPARLRSPGSLESSLSAGLPCAHSSTLAATREHVGIMLQGGRSMAMPVSF